MQSSSSDTPFQLIEQRIAALHRDDFRVIYASYHGDSPFLQQFPTLGEYLEFAAEQLAGRCEIVFCRLLEQRVAATEAELLLHQRLTFAGRMQETVELALVLFDGGEWRFHSSQRLLLEDLAMPPDSITIDLFSKLHNKVVF